jgi:hypothetical protein
VHPNWKVMEDERSVQWLGGRTGPRTPNGLMNWFIRTHLEQCDRIRHRIAELHVFRNTDREPDAVLN